MLLHCNINPFPGHHPSASPPSSNPRPPAHLLEEPLAALISSSARHSATVLMLRKAASRAPVVSSQMACVCSRGMGQHKPHASQQSVGHGAGCTGVQLCPAPCHSSIQCIQHQKHTWLSCMAPLVKAPCPTRQHVQAQPSSSM